MIKKVLSRSLEKNVTSCELLKNLQPVTKKQPLQN